MNSYSTWSWVNSVINSSASLLLAILSLVAWPSWCILACGWLFILSEKESKTTTCSWMKKDFKWLWLKFWWRVHLIRKIIYLCGIKYFNLITRQQGCFISLWTSQLFWNMYISNLCPYMYNLRFVLIYLLCFSCNLKYRINLISLTYPFMSLTRWET